MNTPTPRPQVDVHARLRELEPLARSLCYRLCLEPDSWVSGNNPQRQWMHMALDLIRLHTQLTVLGVPVKPLEALAEENRTDE